VVVGILSADVDIEHGIGVRFSSRPGAAGEQAPDCNVTASHGVRAAFCNRFRAATGSPKPRKVRGADKVTTETM
jgi:hypothetical protein